MKIIPNKLFTNQGFTIIEFLIAIATFSGALIIITLTINKLTSTYYTGVIIGQTQAAAKNIVNTISEQIINSASANITGTSNPPLPWNSTGANLNPANYESFLCIDNNEYIYQIGGIVNPSSVAISADSQASAALILLSDPSCNPTISSTGSPDLNNFAQAFNPINNIFGSNATGATVLSLVPNNMRLLKFIVQKVNNSNNLFFIDVKLAYGIDGNYNNDPSTNNYQQCKTYGKFCSVVELKTYVDKSI